MVRGGIQSQRQGGKEDVSVCVLHQGLLTEKAAESEGAFSAGAEVPRGPLKLFILWQTGSEQFFDGQ